MTFLKIGATAGALALATVLSLGGAKAGSLEDLAAEARAGGTVTSVGMPDDWANWGEIWKGVTAKYGVTHTDTDMSSAEQLAKFEAEKANASVDIGEIGIEFSPVAIKRGLSVPYKTTNWDQIPAWAHDKDGHWAVGYTGTIALVIRKDVKNPPKSFADLLNGDYKVSVGEVGKAAQANAAVLAAAVALGGGEQDLEPAMQFFAKLAQQKRLLPINVNAALMEKGEVEVGVIWDFNALAYRDKVGKDKWDVVIPSDGSITSGYSTVINPYSKHQAIAKLVREYAFSEAGQIAYAKGYARPILIDQLKLPEDVAAKLLPSAQYAKARPINAAIWPDAAKQLTKMWHEEVAPQL
ncbi:MAG TPA: extracellular solute-binding protein [Dongiaceae bacterium]|jgi:putative spermidine/putrescine transport system substrate-binding protein|nr:extracellular solute-binding protein [Dongiaceae bacterium]